MNVRFGGCLNTTIYVYQTHMAPHSILLRWMSSDQKLTDTINLLCVCFRYRVASSIHSISIFAARERTGCRRSNKCWSQLRVECYLPANARAISWSRVQTDTSQRYTTSEYQTIFPRGVWLHRWVFEWNWPRLWHSLFFLCVCGSNWWKCIWKQYCCYKCHQLQWHLSRWHIEQFCSAMHSVRAVVSRIEEQILKKNKKIVFERQSRLNVSQHIHLCILRIRSFYWRNERKNAWTTCFLLLSIPWLSQKYIQKHIESDSLLCIWLSMLHCCIRTNMIVWLWCKPFGGYVQISFIFSDQLGMVG